MTLQRYLQRKDGLPDPRGSLASAVPSKAIAEANKEDQAAHRQVFPLQQLSYFPAAVFATRQSRALL